MKRDYCKNWGQTLKAHDAENSRNVVITTRCKQWSCDYCARLNSAYWSKVIYEHVHASSEQFYFFTLTSAVKRTSDPHQNLLRSLKNVRGAWDKLRKKMRRRCENLQYVRVLERHQDGAVHLHGLTNYPLPVTHYRKSNKRDGNVKQVPYNREFQNMAIESGFGKIVHSEPVAHDAAGASAYIAKYMTKCEDEFADALGRVRRVQTSQNWTKLPERSSDLEWQWTPAVTAWDIGTSVDPWFDLTRKREIAMEDVAGKHYPRDFDNERFGDDE